MSPREGHESSAHEDAAGGDRWEWAATEDGMCDHDEYKEVITHREWGGARVMGVGGHVGHSEAIIVCKKCGKARAVERVDLDGGGRVPPW